jgi:hypothetical protein
MEQWWRENEEKILDVKEQKDPSEKAKIKEHLEDITGRIPLLLKRLLADKRESKFLRSDLVKSIREDVKTFFREKRSEYVKKKKNPQGWKRLVLIHVYYSKFPY